MTTKDALRAALEALPLTSVNELAKAYAVQYASPHHITFTVEGLRNLALSLLRSALEEGGERRGCHYPCCNCNVNMHTWEGCDPMARPANKEPV